MSCLNSKFWNEKQLLPAVKEKLISIAEKAIEDLTGDSPDEQIQIEHIYFTGSLATIGGWHEESDVDLHVIVSGNDTFLEEFTKLYSKWFNETYCFLIHGHEVELNVKIKEETGIEGKSIYDVLEDQWVSGPSKAPSKLDPVKKELVDRYYEIIHQKIVSIIDKNSSLEIVDKVREIIRNVRKKALEQSGEMSIGNLVFKQLRKKGDLELLSDYRLTKETELFSL